MKKKLFLLTFIVICGIFNIVLIAKSDSTTTELLEKKLSYDKARNYFQMVVDKDYSSYDEIYYDFKNEPLFLDTVRPNLTVETYKPYVPSKSNIQFMYDDGNGISTNGIYGIDDRTFLSSSQYTVWPYRAVCQLEMDFYDKNGNIVTYLGSGALVGPNILLTASHCVYSTELGWSSVVRAYPGYRAGIQNYSYASSTAAVIGLYFNTSDSNDDWALIKLNSNIGDTVGYFGLECADINNRTELRNIAYNGATGLMSNTYGRAYGVETYKFYHRIDAIAGSSGSPIFKGHSMNISGIHSAGIHNTDFDYNVACRVSNYLVNDWEELLSSWS